MRAIILAAGFGTRLCPLTKGCPKALLPIGKTTLVDHLVGPLEQIPVIQEITLMTNSRFYPYFSRWRKEARYSKAIYLEENHVDSPEKRLGAVRDLELAIQSRRKEGEDYLILCSDNFFDFPMSHFLLPVLSHPDSGFAGLYDVKEESQASKYGVVQVDHEHRIIDFEEKPARPKSTKISIGVYYFPGVFSSLLDEYLERGFPADPIGSFIGYLIQRETLFGIDFEGLWFDVGDLTSYEQAKRVMEPKRDEASSSIK